MRILLLLLITAFLVNYPCSDTFAENGTSALSAEQQQRGADQSLVLLMEGNLRFVKGSSVYPNQTSHQRKVLALRGQNPFATVVTSSDSRVDPVLIFDRGLGDLFTVRLAGNVAGSDTLASVEYSMLALETPLLVVMGHTRSTLIKAAIDKVELKGHLVQLMGKLEPAIQMTRVLYPSLKGGELADKVAETNVRQVMREILSQCPAVLEKVRSGKAQLMGAVYDTDTGAVRWLGP
ncbi:carbonic anhydrase [Maridesulfovibrio salexigens]|uniref:Carbonic anhydrase n=1 Tax=Maridesulfovibrio salexigens (strain ATCC 14822 / DSM 2638 / NCIMB 8403 / VKM B-1763) TaxID=526222 RepID=C6BU17_MARSD|nr:carbonic anhydrase [Maridesulfovibrio salexigens]ACS81726.1 carbonic anhydrase [Maridesulfovibrio salexigens DSM 2638]